MKVTIAFPHRAGNCPFRKKAFPYVQSAFKRLFPDAEQIIVDSGHTYFNVAASRNLAVKQAGSGIVVIADSDMLPSEQGIRSAVNAAAHGGVHLPFTRYRALSHASTARFYLRKLDPHNLASEYESTESVAGCIVVRADVWDDLGGMDERFEHWGWEDNAFSYVVESLLGGMIRHEGITNHLFHPNLCRPKSESYLKNKALSEEYKRLIDDPVAMREYIRNRPCA